MVVDPYLSQQLRPHQRSGVLFLYSRLLGFTKVQGLEGEEQTVEGAILADEMGLGKTLQTVTIVWTLLKQSPIAGTQVVKKVLVVAPSSLLKNWEKEFRKWLGNERITIHIADTGEKVAQFRSYGSAPVLLLSYEMMVRCFKELLQVPWDLVVCDEAHRLKNSSSQGATCLASLPCKRRLLLTGTPVQNDLGEFWCLLEAAAPGLLGARQQFSKMVEGKVETARQPGASEQEQLEGRKAMEMLELMTKQLVLRRTAEVVKNFLPPKTVNVVFCRPLPAQADIYASEVETLWSQVRNLCIQLNFDKF